MYKYEKQNCEFPVFLFPCMILNIQEASIYLKIAIC